MKRTPLYAAFQAAGARFVDFAGWEMPVQIRGIRHEHEAVRRGVGLFDVSHMGEIEVRGPGAAELCQQVTTNDVSKLVVGRAIYSPWCDEQGGTIDDTILYRPDEKRWLFCVNAGNVAVCLEWLTTQARGRADIEVLDFSLETALVAVQGPRASALVGTLGATSALLALRRFSCVETLLAGVPALVARTGYTGEDGFEIFVNAARVEALWTALLEVGASHAVELIGLGARDTLRLEAALPLYGHELSREISPLEAGLDFAVKLDGPAFLGREALRRQRTAGLQRRLIGLVAEGAGIPREGYEVIAKGRVVGRVTSGTQTPWLDRPIALALVESAEVEAALAVRIRGRDVSVRRVETPFYRQGMPPGLDDARSAKQGN